MGFMGSMQSEERTPQIQVYDFEYKQLHVLNLTGLEENMIYIGRGASHLSLRRSFWAIPFNMSRHLARPRAP